MHYELAKNLYKQTSATSSYTFLSTPSETRSTSHIQRKPLRRPFLRVENSFSGLENEFRSLENDFSKASNFPGWPPTAKKFDKSSLPTKKIAGKNMLYALACYRYTNVLSPTQHRMECKDKHDKETAERNDERHHERMFGNEADEQESASTDWSHHKHRRGTLGQAAHAT